MPGWLDPSLPVGAVVVGGGTTLNGASQITNGGTNAGSNLTAVRNLFTYADQVTLTHGKHLLEAGVWLQRIQANDTLIQDQYGQASFTSLHIVSAAAYTVSTYTFAPLSPTPLGWRSLEGAFYRRGHNQAEAELGTGDRIPRRVHQRLERGARPRLELPVQLERRDRDPACRRQLRSDREQREVPARAARWHRMVAIRFEEDRDPRRASARITRCWTISAIAWTRIRRSTPCTP